MKNKIVIKGAREHNLKNVNLEIPRNQMTVFTGVSGSGKSSLAFDTIFAEGQRRYVESLSAYARQFLGGMQRPDVDEIEGLSPAISIDQKVRGRNPRSTVATITEIYDYLRVLFARVGEPLCPDCDNPIDKKTTEEMVDVLIVKAKEVYGLSLRAAKQAKQSRGSGKKEAGSPRRSAPRDDLRSKETTILAPVVVGRKGEYHQMLYDMYNAGFMYVRVDGKRKTLQNKIELNPKKKHTIELVTDFFGHYDFENIDKDGRARLAEAIETGLDYGNDVITLQFADGQELTLSAKFSCSNCDFSFPEIEPRLFSFNSPYGACPECLGIGMLGWRRDKLCHVCDGRRLRPEAQSVYLGGPVIPSEAKRSRGIPSLGDSAKNIVEIVSMDVETCLSFFLELSLSKTKAAIAGPAIREIINRLQFMQNVGLDYLTLDRKSGTLSGGESQRIRLASQVGLRLVGGLYVLDEPTIGLHQADSDRLVATLKELKELGNTVIIVEHDENTISAADYLVDFGPGAGKHGGEIVCAGAMPQILQNKDSITCAYLRGDKKIESSAKRRSGSKGALKIIGATTNNLKGVSVDIPLQRFVCITGVSGSGKSSLMHDTLYSHLAKKFGGKSKTTGVAKEIKGLEYISRAVMIDQSPIGRTPRSNPATYTGVFTYIREIFAATPEARFRNYKIGRFSFNTPGGRCEACSGHGYNAIEMHFLPTVYVTCEVCKGRRFDRETLEVHFKGKNIAQVLKFTVDEAVVFFKDIPHIYDKLLIMQRVGLGYIQLGQSATTLSGGEAQRVKLSNELAKKTSDRTFYLFDEPTTGLHFEDVRKLLEVLKELVDRGHTVAVIEHNLDVINTADYVIDLGPGGGKYGGQVIAKGTPEQIMQSKKSLTGKYLKEYLT